MQISDMCVWCVYSNISSQYPCFMKLLFYFGNIINPVFSGHSDAALCDQYIYSWILYVCFRVVLLLFPFSVELLCVRWNHKVPGQCYQDIVMDWEVSQQSAIMWPVYFLTSCVAYINKDQPQQEGCGLNNTGQTQHKIHKAFVKVY